MAESRKRELAVINENTLLRQNFAECLKKAEDFRDQLKPLNEANAQLKADLDKSKEQMVGDCSMDCILEFVEPFADFAGRPNLRIARGNGTEGQAGCLLAKRCSAKADAKVAKNQMFPALLGFGLSSGG
jgi:hypothetical protein